MDVTQAFRPDQRSDHEASRDQRYIARNMDQRSQRLLSILLLTQEAINPHREVLVFSDQRRVEGRQEIRRLMVDAHLRDGYQRGCQRQRAIGIAGDCVIIGSPLGVARPLPLEFLKPDTNGRASGAIRQRKRFRLSREV